MKPVVLLVAAGAIALASGAVVSVLGSSGPPQASPEVVRLSAEMRSLAAAVEQLRQGQEVLAARAAAERPATPATAVSLAEIERAVERVLLARGAPAAAELAAGGTEAPPEVEPPLSAEAAFAQLTVQADEHDRDQVWQQIREAGLTDQVIAMFEDLAARDPNDPELQVAKGVAYLEKIQEVGNGPLAGVWATKADQAFDAALVLDDRNWDARFTKAVALSFWPPIFGKQNEAVRHFETLLEQQRSQSPQPQFAQTYLLLGNMYNQLGQQGKALEVWTAGSQLFPDDGDLVKQIATAK